MITAPKRKSVVFATLGICLVAVAVALNVSWIVINWREGLLLALGLILFPLVIAGLVLNTIFLVREVRRTEQHDAFINAVTHELKTPVASIRLYLETLERRELPQEKRREFYRVMIDDSDRLLQLIEQVLQAGRTSARAVVLHQVRVDLRDTVRECLDLARMRHHLEPEALSYSDRLGNPRQATVLGDPDELKAALSNLVDNAIKYSNNGVHVDVELTPVDERRVAIRVTDQGIGISPGELKRIFRRFYRIPEAVAMRIKGTGLGLFIVSSIARKHGGRVFAESSGPGRGSTFTLQLPVAPPA
jgi:two-component system sensor histidine kinase SenX3